MKLTNKTYWRGTEQLKNDPEFVKNNQNEFSEKLPLEGENDNSNKSTRRDFLKMMGFGVAAVSLAACEAPVKKAIPYLNKPESVEPGIANYYASTFYDGGEFCSVLVKTREGRPIFVSGNSMSSVTGGGVNVRVSASVLSLYDEENQKFPTRGTQDVTSEADLKKLDEEIRNGLASAGNVRIVTNTVISPSSKRVINDFIAKYPGTKHVTYDPISLSAIREAYKQGTGKAVLPGYRFDKAKVIVGLGADFLGGWINNIEYASQYAKTRRVTKENPEMSRHFQFESNFSITGASADYRAPVKPSDEGKIAATLYNKVASQLGGTTVSVPAADAPFLDLCAKNLVENKGKGLVVSGSNDVNIQLIVAALNDLLGNNAAVDTSKPNFQKQGDDAAMNTFVDELKNGSVGGVIFIGANPVYDHPRGQEIKAGLSKAKVSVGTSLKLDETSKSCKYNYPNRHFLESWNDAEPKKGHFTLAQPTIRPIFTSRQAQDSLLVWAGTEDKTYLDYIKEYWLSELFPKQSKETDPTQFWNRSLHDGVLEVDSDYESVHEGATVSISIPTANIAAPEGEEAPVSQDNVSAETNASGESADADVTEASVGSFDLSSAASGISARYKSGGKWELVIYEHPIVGTGAMANNPWIQETPEPISKVTWGQFIAVPEADANELGIKMNEGNTQVAELTVNGKTVKLPVVSQPGLKSGTLTIALGYGRPDAGKVAAQAGGHNAYEFMKVVGGFPMYSVLSGVDVKLNGETDYVAQTQTHGTYMGRETIVQETLLKNYKDGSFKKYDPKIATSKGATTPEDISIWDLNSDGYQGHDPHHTIEKEKPAAEKKLWLERHPFDADTHKYPIHHWGMAIDLNTCTGCSACIVACSLENNVPVVGREEVYRRREMHWMRIDRYYSSSAAPTDLAGLEKAAENPEVVFQPMMCQHCNNAPCETVCPVVATTHSSEGLNQMTYNRCIGTKYCANNCPYKVRRFNWFRYHTNEDFDYYLNSDLGRMVLNPDVTVRSRGVMEKCSLCVQRIQNGKLKARREKRKLKDGEVNTACASACPTNAITFGDLNNPESEICKVIEPELKMRAYNVLKEINVRPNVWYLTKVRNQDEARTQVKEEAAPVEEAAAEPAE